jgi:hypothetical protein
MERGRGIHNICEAGGGEGRGTGLNSGLSSKMSVTSVGGGAGGVQIFSLINFNTPFRSCFTKEVYMTIYSRTSFI